MHLHEDMQTSDLTVYLFFSNCLHESYCVRVRNAQNDPSDCSAERLTAASASDENVEQSEGGCCHLLQPGSKPVSVLRVCARTYVLAAECSCERIHASGQREREAERRRRLRHGDVAAARILIAAPAEPRSPPRSLPLFARRLQSLLF